MALLFAWAFELTEDGVKLTKNVPTTDSITKYTGRKLDFAIIGVLVVAIIYLIVELQSRDAARETAASPESAETVPAGSETVADDRIGVAVLPFVNMSNDPDNEYFSDGISEELLNVLVKVKSLRVPSRTSSFKYKGSNLDIPEIAQELNVDHVLEGSVRKDGNKVRVTAQLIEVGSDSHLWSETYNRELDDIFAIQEEISTAIVDALKVTLGAEEESAIARIQNATSDPRAYELYMQGRYQWRLRGEGPIRDAIRLFEAAIELDREYAEAWSGLAAAWTVLEGYSDVRPTETEALVFRAANQALMLDPTLSEPYAVMAWADGTLGRYQDMRGKLEKAIALDPRDSTSMLWMGLHHLMLGRVDEAERWFEKGRAVDPGYGIVTAYLGYIQMMRSELHAALPLLIESYDQGWKSVAFSTTIAYAFLDDWESSDLWIDRFTEVDPKFEKSMRLFLDVLKNPQLREANIRKIAQEADEHDDWDNSNYFSVFGYLEANDEAVKSIHAMIEADSTYQVMAAWEEPMHALRQDTRFKTALQESGFIDDWRSYGWPDLCQPAGDSFECD